MPRWLIIALLPQVMDYICIFIDVQISTYYTYEYTYTGINLTLITKKIIARWMSINMAKNRAMPPLFKYGIKRLKFIYLKNRLQLSDV